VLGLAAGNAQAQEAPRRIEFGGSLQVTYDDNVLRASEQRAATQDLETSDLIYSPGAFLNFNLPVGRHSAFLRSTAAYDVYQRNDRLNRERASVVGGVNATLARCVARPSLSFSRGQTEFFDRSIDLTEETVDNVTDRRAFDVQLSCPRQVGLSPFASYRVESSRNSNAIRQDVDTDSESASVGASYTRGSFGTASVSGSWSDVRFPRRAPGVSDGYELQAVGLRYERPVGARLSVRGAVSQTDVQSRPGLGALDFRGVTWGVGVTARSSTALTTQLSYDREVQPSNRVGLSYSIDETVAARADYQLGTRILLSGGVSRSERSYRGVTQFAVPAVDETLTAIYATARYDLNRRWAFVADLRRDDRESDVPTFGYVSNSVSVTALARF
jgi:hypothetical protein